jgi:hypothetical protein
MEYINRKLDYLHKPKYKLKSFLSNILIWLLIIIAIAIFTFVVSNRFIVPAVPLFLVLIILKVTKSQRTLINKKPTPIYELTEGLVKIEGIISAHKSFETPHFKQQCIAYIYEEGNVTYDSETGSENVNKTFRKEEFQDFCLSNATGKIKVIITRLNLSLLPAKTETLHSIKYAVDDIRYTERTLKNGEMISVLGYAVRNDNHQFELREQGDKPFVIGTPDVEDETRKSFKVLKGLWPYFILMYVGVNYFLFAPLQIQIQESEIFPYFAIFGMPFLAIVLILIGNRFKGLAHLFLINLAGICFSVSFLTFPLLCLFYMIKLEFSRIICIWVTIFVCTTIALVMNHRRLDWFDKNKSA